MEDLREVGQKAIESVNKLRSSDAGDLVLGIGEIIEELREQPELYQEKLDHLEGLFREFAYGEGYQLRNNRADILEEDMKQTIGTIGQSLPSSFSPKSGHVSGILPQNTFSSVAGIPPVMPSAPSPDQDDAILKEAIVEECEQSMYRDTVFAADVYKENQQVIEKALGIPEVDISDVLKRNKEAVARSIVKEIDRKPFKPRWWQSKA